MNMVDSFYMCMLGEYGEELQLMINIVNGGN
jgi:hypothetical protein